MRKHLTTSSYITGEKASMSSFTWHVPSRLFSFVGGQGKVAGDYDETKETTGDGQVSSFTIFFFLITERQTWTKRLFLQIVTHLQEKLNNFLFCTICDKTKNK